MRELAPLKKSIYSIILYSSFGKEHSGISMNYAAIVGANLFAPANPSAEVFSIIDLREILLGCNSRYLEFLSSLDDYSDGSRALVDPLSQPAKNRQRSPSFKPLPLLDKLKILVIF